MTFAPVSVPLTTSVVQELGESGARIRRSEAEEPKTVAQLTATFEKLSKGNAEVTSASMSKTPVQARLSSTLPQALKLLSFSHGLPEEAPKIAGGGG